MKIKVLFFGRPRELAKSAHKIVSVKKDARLSDLLQLLENRYGIKYSSDLKQKEAVMVMINGRHSASLGGLKAPLGDMDTVAIMPVVVGG